MKHEDDTQADGPLELPEYEGLDTTDPELNYLTRSNIVPPENVLPLPPRGRLMTGADLRQARQQAGLSQRALAGRIGCYQADLSRVENGLIERAAAALRAAMEDRAS